MSFRFRRDGSNGDREPARAPGSPLRVVVVGAGSMGRHHARAIRSLPTLARVVAVVDPREDARAELARLCPGASAHESLETALAEADPDVAHICTTPATHAELTERAIRARVHCYVEKPFAASADVATHLLSLAASQGVKVTAGHQLLFERPAARLRHLLPAIGTVVHAESYFAFRQIRTSANGRTPLRADLQLLDVLPHPVYLLLHTLAHAVPEGTTELRAVEIGREGTVHALVSRGGVTGTLVVTLAGRPVESRLVVTGTRGTLHADFVRGTVQRLLGPGTSAIDKVVAPFSLGGQLLLGTAGSLARRVLARQRSYPGLAESFAAFYEEIRDGAPSPVTTVSVAETVAICERIAAALERPCARTSGSSAKPDTPVVLLTGGTGYLGREVADSLVGRGARVRSIARREPAPWERRKGVEYVVADLGDPLPPELFSGVEVVVHCAAETVGGWEAHERNSVRATEHVLRGAAAAGVNSIVHVSSLAVVSPDVRTVSEESPRAADGRSLGPYVWGKLESERVAERLAAELGLVVKIVRPGALVDLDDLDPPGRLGRRLGPLFVAVGRRGDRLGIADVREAGRILARLALEFDRSPCMLHLLSAHLPTKGELVARLRFANPDLRVVWVPPVLLRPLSALALLAQRMLRPGRPAIDVARVFSTPDYDTSRVARLSLPARVSPPASVLRSIVAAVPAAHR